MFKKLPIFFLVFAAIFIIAVFAFFNQESQIVKAGSEHNTFGFAWSENIGWVSFNNTSGGGATNYGVNIAPATGLFAGYAWSENIGWIDFAPAGPYPASPNYSACLDFSGPGQTCDGLGTNKAGGWARALSYGGGWDGWIKLRGSNYGVDYTPQSGELSGWAWFDMVIGWLSFNRVNCDANKDGLSDGTPAGCPSAGTPISNYKVVTTAKLPPSVSAAGENWLFCTDSLHPILNWTYSDGIQAAYQIQIDNTSAGFPSPEVDTGEVISSSQSYTTTYSFSWDTKYWWRVKVKNQQSVWSGWSNISNFTTPKHAYPKSDFSHTPLNPTMNETVRFTDLSQVYGGATITNWFWTFQDGSPSNSSLQNPQTKFISVGSKKVTLGVRDSDGYDCGITNPADASSKTINVAFPLPKWKEILPR